MNVTRVVRDGAGCTVYTDYGRYANWPGRELGTGQPWWSFTPADGRRAVVVTVPETIVALERARSQAAHPSSQLPRPHLTLVTDRDPTPPHGIERPQTHDANNKGA